MCAGRADAVCSCADMSQEPCIWLSTVLVVALTAYSWQALGFWHPFLRALLSTRAPVVRARMLLFVSAFPGRCLKSACTAEVC